MAKVFRVLRPGGWFIASDWLIGVEGKPGPAMAACIAAKGLDFGMATPARHADAMAQAGFVGVRALSRNLWYRDQARLELARPQGDAGARATAVAGADFVAHDSAIWSRMIPVLGSGEHCPTHLCAQKPHHSSRRS